MKPLIEGGYVYAAQPPLFQSFIGPEYLYDSRQVIRAGLEDHFMGKLTGISMGCDACYTNHMKADQNDIENLAVLLTSAGCNYFMGIPHGDDVMLTISAPDTTRPQPCASFWACAPSGSSTSGWSPRGS